MPSAAAPAPPSSALPPWSRRDAGGRGGIVRPGRSVMVPSMFLPDLLKLVLSPVAASTAGPALSSMLIYILMAVVLVVRPAGLFPVASR